MPKLQMLCLVKNRVGVILLIKKNQKLAINNISHFSFSFDEGMSFGQIGSHDKIMALGHFVL